MVWLRVLCHFAYLIITIDYTVACIAAELRTQLKQVHSVYAVTLNKVMSLCCAGTVLPVQVQYVT